MPRSRTPLTKAPPSVSADSSPLALLNDRVVRCERCPRLRAYDTEIAHRRRRAYHDWVYWGKPVPSFGDPLARVLILGLAPGAHGSNRTGRPFTGDGSGDFLYPVLYDAGFASQPKATSRDDGMRLIDCWITSVVRCAPPDNKPLPEELANCARYLDEEVAALANLRVIVCLGRIAFTGFLKHLVRRGTVPSAAPFAFAHAAEYRLPGGLTLLASYHPSLQNTNTGKLTREMFLAVFDRARTLAQAAKQPV